MNPMTAMTIKILKEFAVELAPSLVQLYNHSLMSLFLIISSKTRHILA